LHEMKYPGVKVSSGKPKSQIPPGRFVSARSEYRSARSSRDGIQR
jgi:hypothetical protein